MAQHGFELIREEHVSEIHSEVRLYKHIKSGAEFLSVTNDDENKVFGITFRTPPATSNGLPHIMEHCVLGGSRKYPLKEPFIELVKGSLNTFLNAFTYPDRTCYPVASTNLQDFYNLVDVYLDSVFHPLITPHHLDQEGWHYELENIDDPLKFKGVVFNEMKGAYSSPEGVLGRYQQESLFSVDHPYGVDSGGDPTVIPELTYNEFKAFHENYYHPSNSRIYFYGDDDPEKRLALLDEYLKDFDEIDVDTAVAAYPIRDKAERHVYPYAVDPSEADNAKQFVSVNWLLPEITDVTTQMGLSILSSVLSGSPGAPLRRALTESGLGEDTLGGGFASYLRQPMFSAGMKGVKEEDIPKVEALIEETLQKLVTEGIEPAAIEAAVNTYEFRLREANTGSYPRGLVYMLGALNPWIYDGDPYEGLKYEEPLQAVKDGLAQGNFFESLLANYVLENNHRSTVILEPDAELAQRLEAEEETKLTAAKENMSQDELEAIIANTQALKERQEAQDSPENLAKLPSLTLADLERPVKSLPLDVNHYGQTEVIHHDLFTNGIIYFRLGMNMRVIPSDLLPYLPLFSYALTEIGTETENYVQLTQRIGRLTGGVGASRQTSTVRGQKEALAWLWVRGKATMDRAQDMLDIIRDVLLTVKLDNQERFRQMLLEEKAGQESSIVPSGHSVALSRLSAHFTEAGWLSEVTGGTSYLFFLRQLIEDVENDWSSVVTKLEKIRMLLVNRNNMMCATTLDDENYQLFQPQIHNLLDQMPTAEVNHENWERSEFPENEGLTIPAQVNYVAKAVNLFDHGFTHHGSVSVITNLMRTGYLWEKIRMQGGAYGAFMPYNAHSGVVAFCSYRDPNLENTLNVYDQAADYLADLPLTQDQVEKAIIGVIGNVDSYQLPDAKGRTALTRYLLGTTDEYRQKRRNEILDTTVEDFRQFAKSLKVITDEGHVVVVGSADGIQKVNESLDENKQLTLTKVM